MRLIDRDEAKTLRDDPNLCVINLAACPKRQVKKLDGFSLEKCIDDLRQVFILFEDGDEWR